MKKTGILLIETSLEGSLRSEENRRTQFETFRGMQRSNDFNFSIYHERIYDIQGLRNVFNWCEKQNNKIRSSKIDATFKEATSIAHIHISSHGTEDCLDLPRVACKFPRATEDDLVDAFSILESSKISTIFLSSCKTGKNFSLSKRILEKTKSKAIIGYPEVAYDHICAIVEQILYFQLLNKPKIPIKTAVRRANDAIVLIGENPARCMACWVKEDGEILGPDPWWDYNGDRYERNDRSYIAWLKDIVSGKSRVTEKKLKEIRSILESI